jgi:DNA-binding SARP family transcriptional activator
MNRRLRAGVAAICLVVLLAGIPTLLAATVGNPGAGWSDLLAGDVSDTVVIDVLAAVAYLAWAPFAVAVAVEAVSALAHRPPRRGIPGVLGAQQHLAHVLVTALLIAPAAASPAIHTAPTVAAAATTPPTASSAALAATARKAPDTIRYVVRHDGPGTYWDLAETYLGNGQRWPEIWHLNRGRHQDDGAVMSSAGLLRPSWTVLIPNTDPAAGRVGAGTVVVRRGDTLGEIAADHDLPGWNGLWRLNHGRVEPGDKRFTDPHHIEPGWTIQLPHAEAAQEPPPGGPPSEPPGRAAAVLPDATPSHPAAVSEPTATHGPTPGRTASGPTTRSTTDPSVHAPSDLPAEHRHETVGVELSDGWIGLPLAAALAAAAAMVWRHRRRRYRFGLLDPADLDDVDLIPLPGTITAARRALREHAPHLLDPPPAVQPAVAAYSADPHSQPPPPPGPTGLHLAGLANLADLVPGTGLGLTGPGAEAAGRALLVATLSTGGPDDPEAKGSIVIPADTLTGLLGAHALDIDPIPRLTVTPNLPDALTTIEEILIHRRRTLDDHASTPAGDDRHDAATSPYPPLLPPVLLLTDAPPDHQRERLASTISLGPPVRISAAILGDWAPGTTLTVDTDGHAALVGQSLDHPAGAGPGQRIATLDVPTTLDLLRVLREAHTGHPTSQANSRTPPDRAPMPVRPDAGSTRTDHGGHPATGSGKVQIRLLGPPAILDQDAQPVPGLRLHARELLVYLAVHRTGADLSDLMEALWPDATVRRAQERLSTEVANLRRCIRAAADNAGVQPVVNTGGRYHLNSDMLDIDIWTLDDALRQGAATQDLAARADTLRRAVDAHTGVLADGHDYDWIEPHREHHRRHGIRARIQLADHMAETDSQQAAALTGAAADLDPANEDLARRHIRALHRVGDGAGVKQRLQILTHALDDIDENINSTTLALAKNENAMQQ